MSRPRAATPPSALTHKQLCAELVCFATHDHHSTPSPTTHAHVQAGLKKRAYRPPAAAALIWCLAPPSLLVVGAPLSLRLQPCQRLRSWCCRTSRRGCRQPHGPRRVLQHAAAGAVAAAPAASSGSAAAPRAPRPAWPTSFTSDTMLAIPASMATSFWSLSSGQTARCARVVVLWSSAGSTVAVAMGDVQLLPAFHARGSCAHHAE